MFRLDNKVAIITGGASGIGKAIGAAFLRQGARVHLMDRNESQLLETVGELTQIAQKVQGHVLDLTDGEAVTRLFEAISGETGQVDVLVNNAAIAHVGTVETTTPEELDQIYAVNVKGVFHGMQAAIPLMKQKGGSIINLASVVSAVGIPDRFAYTMSKGAVWGMTLSVAKDYVSSGIRCNAIAPARIHTPFVDGFLADNYPGKEAEMFTKLSQTQPIGRMGTPEEVAAMAVYLAAEESSFVTGSLFPIDGGFITLNN